VVCAFMHGKHRTGTGECQREISIEKKISQTFV
jgi:hypothetical protein